MSRVTLIFRPRERPYSAPGDNSFPGPHNNIIVMLRQQARQLCKATDFSSSSSANYDTKPATSEYGLLRHLTIFHHLRLLFGSLLFSSIITGVTLATSESSQHGAGPLLCTPHERLVSHPRGVLRGWLVAN
ncbi:hypothetical protein RRG08_040722 [Elysia crispata]|uniref:Uncharacterized protein n=1 Tax=Elysia crispata TaxID=231223 RepID=A0AAE1BDN2_9GAST|nr:hypothetical protein RRG08_040722 [Elysia crispata]